MNGYTIKSVSEEGIYYMVKNWRKNKAIWVKGQKLKQEYLYKTETMAIRALEKLLNLMDDYASDYFTIVFCTDGNITECDTLTVINDSNDIWKPDYKVAI